MKTELKLLSSLFLAPPSEIISYNMYCISLIIKMLYKECMLNTNVHII